MNKCINVNFNRNIDFYNQISVMLIIAFNITIHFISIYVFFDNRAHIVCISTINGYNKMSKIPCF